MLAKELEQLGLPKGAHAATAAPCHAALTRRRPRRAEHADAVCKPYSKERERLRSAVVAATLQLVRAAPIRAASRGSRVGRPAGAAGAHALGRGLAAGFGGRRAERC